MMEQKRIGRGRITAECRQSDGSCIASELFAQYPVRLHLTSRPNSEMKVQYDRDEKKNCQQKAVTCYVLGYGGGLISGDCIDLEIIVKTGASLVVTSQSTCKAFKSVLGRPTTILRTKASVAPGSLLVLVPQPTQCFGGSRLNQETLVHMNSDNSSNQFKQDPSLLLVDWYTGGRTNMDGGLWYFDLFWSKTTISYPPPSEETCVANGNKGVESLGPELIRLSKNVVFRDSTRLSGGSELKRHMRHFNVVCMVVLIGPRVQAISDSLLRKFSSRHKYDSGLNFDQGDGLNRDGLLVSCGTFITMKNVERGVVLRVAASSLEKAARFLSEHLGTLDDQIENDPFLEILASKQGMFSSQSQRSETEKTDKESAAMNEKLSLDLMARSFVVDSTSCLSETTRGINECDRNGLHRLMHGVNDRCRVDKVSPLVLYQLVDSCAPTGGFAHSNTIEAAHQLRLVSSSSDSLLQYMWDVLMQTATSILPFLVASCRLLRPQHQFISNTKPGFCLELSADLIDAWNDIDTMHSATLTSHVTCRASLLQGSGIFRAFAAAFPRIAPAVRSLKNHALKMHEYGNNRLHAATCFGAICGLLGMDDETGASAFLYTTARDMVNAAVRMNLVGPLKGGRLTNILCARLEDLIGTLISDRRGLYNQDIMGRELLLASVHQVAPLVEILSNAHDRLYTRLFNS